MRKIRFTVGLSLLALMMSVTTVAQAQKFTMATDPATPNAYTMTYDANDGHVSWSGNGTLISTSSLISASNSFIPANLNPAISPGDFDVFTANKFFQLKTAGVEAQDYGMVLPAGMTAQALIDDITVDGSIKPSGKLPAAAGGGPYLNYIPPVPEPSSILLTVFGLLGLVGLRRKS